MFYNANIKPHVDYCSTLWDGAADVHLQKLNSIHRRAGKIILKNPALTTDEKFQHLKLLPLSSQLKFNKGVFMYKAWKETLPPYLNDIFKKHHSKYSTSRLDFTIPKPRIDLYKTSIAFSGSHLWNSLPLEIKTAPTLPTFKKRLRKQMLESEKPP